MAVMQPRDTLSTILSGHLIAQAVSVATRLGIPDLVADRPQRVGFLAQATRSHPDGLYRLLRALASAGIFVEKGRRQFGRTPLSDLLRRGVPGSLREVAILGGEPWRQASYALAGSLRAGRPAFEAVHGMPLYSYLARHPRSLRLFSEVMAYHWSQLSEAILRVLDCSGIRRIVDVGGGPGSLLQTLLEMRPGLTGVVLDLPVVAAATRRRLAAAGLAPRSRVLAGDFFRGVPRGGDLYVLAFVLHNWDDRRAMKILERCREAMSATSRLVVIEMLVPADTRPAAAKIHDLEMLVFTSGRERTAAEYRALLRAAGLRLRRVVATGTAVSLIEARKINAEDLPKRSATRSTAPRRHGGRRNTVTVIGDQ
jgi:hypothetical protein